VRKLPIAVAVLSHTVVDAATNIYPLSFPSSWIGSAQLLQVGVAAALANISSSMLQPAFGWVSIGGPRGGSCGSASRDGILMVCVGLARILRPPAGHRLTGWGLRRSTDRVMAVALPRGISAASPCRSSRRAEMWDLPSARSWRVVDVRFRAVGHVAVMVPGCSWPRQSTRAATLCGAVAGPRPRRVPAVRRFLGR